MYIMIVMINNMASGQSWAGILRDLRYGWRGMRKTPVFTAFAVLTLGLGIGANTTVFTIVNTLLLHPLPVGDPSRLAARLCQLRRLRGTAGLVPWLRGVHSTDGDDAPHGHPPRARIWRVCHEAVLRYAGAQPGARPLFHARRR